MPIPRALRSTLSKLPTRRSATRPPAGQVSLPAAPPPDAVTTMNLTLSASSVEVGQSLVAEATSVGSSQPQYKFELVAPDGTRSYPCGDAWLTQSSRCTVHIPLSAAPGSWRVVAYARGLSATVDSSTYDESTTRSFSVIPAQLFEPPAPAPASPPPAQPTSSPSPPPSSATGPMALMIQVTPASAGPGDTVRVIAGRDSDWQLLGYRYELFDPAARSAGTTPSHTPCGADYFVMSDSCSFVLPADAPEGTWAWRVIVRYRTPTGSATPTVDRVAKAGFTVTRAIPATTTTPASTPATPPVQILESTTTTSSSSTPTNVSINLRKEAGTLPTTPRMSGMGSSGMLLVYAGVVVLGVALGWGIARAAMSGQAGASPTRRRRRRRH